MNRLSKIFLITGAMLGIFSISGCHEYVESGIDLEYVYQNISDTPITISGDNNVASSQLSLSLDPGQSDTIFINRFPCDPGQGIMESCSPYFHEGATITIGDQSIILKGYNETGEIPESICNALNYASEKLSAGLYRLTYVFDSTTCQSILDSKQ